MGQFSTDGIEQYCQQNDREHESPAGWIWARLPTRQKPVKDLPMSYMHIYTHTYIYTRLNGMYVCLCSHLCTQTNMLEKEEQNKISVKANLTFFSA